MMRRTWTHRTCERCWFDGPGRDVSGGPVSTLREAGQVIQVRIPHQITGSGLGLCCYCGGVLITGIYVRESPAEALLHCGGQHDEGE